MALGIYVGLSVVGLWAWSLSERSRVSKECRGTDDHNNGKSTCSNRVLCEHVDDSRIASLSYVRSPPTLKVWAKRPWMLGLGPAVTPSSQ